MACSELVSLAIYGQASVGAVLAVWKLSCESCNSGCVVAVLAMLYMSSYCAHNRVRLVMT